MQPTRRSTSLRRASVNQPGGYRQFHGVRGSNRLRLVCNNRATGREDTVEKESTTKQKGIQEHFQAVVDVLLFRAASRVERGVATCLECKGSGYCMCSSCQGAGVIAPVKRPSLASGPRLQSLMGNEKGDQWLTTNRCLKCHGRGNVGCGTCDGSGLRAPPMIPGSLGRRSTVRED